MGRAICRHAAARRVSGGIGMCDAPSSSLILSGDPPTRTPFKAGLPELGRAGFPALLSQGGCGPSSRVRSQLPSCFRGGVTTVSGVLRITNRKVILA